MPTEETVVPSRKTPTKNPSVTMLHAKRMRREGDDLNAISEVTTVNGKTSPRATW